MHRKMGRPPNPVGQQLVGLVGDGLLGGLVHQHLLDDLIDEVILLVDDVFLVAAVQHLGQIHGVVPGDFRVVLQQLDGVPPQILQAGVFLFQRVYQQVYLVLNFIAVHHHVLPVMVVTVACLLGVVVAGGLCGLLVLVVGRRVHQNVQAGFPPGGDGNHRDAQHLRQAVQVDLHATLLHNVHHIQRQDNRLAQLNQLQGQIQVAL